MSVTLPTPKVTIRNRIASESIEHTRGSVTFKRAPEKREITSRTLIITPSYTPQLNPRAFRWSAIAERWRAQGKKIHVLTSWKPGWRRSESINSVSVNRAGGAISESLRTRFSAKSRQTSVQNIGGKPAFQAKRGIAGAIAHFINDRIWKNIYWPDYACLWIRPALREASRIISSQNIATVITVSDPFSAHAVGLKLKKRYPNISWIVDIGDPFSFRTDSPTNNHTLYSGRNRRFERRVFAQADSIVVTTESTQQAFIQMYPDSAHKITVVGPLLDSVTANNLSVHNSQSPLSNVKKLVFTGALYRSVRNPSFLLQLFEKLYEVSDSPLELHFYGGYADCEVMFAPYKELLGSTIHLHGLVTRDEVIDAISTADVLINIANNNHYQLPSKLVEYTASGKPIINIRTCSKDCSTEFLNGYPSVLHVNANEYGPTEAQVIGVKQFMESATEVDPTMRSSWIGRASVESVAEQYTEIRKSLTQVTKQSTKSIWHIYYATRGAAGSYMDELLSASHKAGLSATAFVSARYAFKANNVHRWFFNLTDLISSRKGIAKIARGCELVAAYIAIAIAATFKKPKIVVHLIDDLKATALMCKYLKWTGCELWITCHDVGSHYKGVDSQRRLLFELADKLIVHNHGAREALIEAIGQHITDKVIQYPFPNSSYAEIISSKRMTQISKQLENELTVKKGFVLFLGVARMSKGIDILHEAWKQMRNVPGAHLVYAGVWTDPPIELRRDTENDPSVTIIDRYLSEEEIIWLIEHSCCVVLPYPSYAHSAILSSCANYNATVIVTDIPLFRELLPDDYPLMYETGSAALMIENLSATLKRMFQMSTGELDECRQALRVANKAKREELVQALRGAYLNQGD